MTIRIGNAPCSWGVMGGFDPALFPPWPSVLDEIASTGYEGTELGDWGFLPTDTEVLRAELSSRRLSMIGALVPVAWADASAHAAGRESALRTARLLAACAQDEAPRPFVILADANGTDSTRTRLAGRIRPEHALTEDAWRTFARGVEEAARALMDETSLRTVFHHHCAGFIETPEETARLLEMTSPDLLGLCYDTGHWAYAGGELLAGLERFRERIWHVHYKDVHADVADQARSEGWDYIRAVEGGIFRGLGTGELDFKSLTARLCETNYEGWVVVEDELPPGMGEPAEAARRDRNFVRSLGL